MGFLSDLGNTLNSQFSLEDNSNLNKHNSLGEFAKKIDQSAQRKYVEEGFVRQDPFNVDVKAFEILMQEPNATVLIKKRMFSSIAENWRSDYMDKDEKLYYKAIKILFDNKCKQIAALEKLSKIQKINSAIGNISEQLLPVIIGLTDDAGSGFNSSGVDLFGGTNANSEISNFTKIVDRLRKLYAFNTPSNTTSWIKDTTSLFNSTIGQGTGVIEITNFTNLNTTCTVDTNSKGNFSLSIVDPYEAMVITEYDIEKALADVTNVFSTSKFTQFGQTSVDELISADQAILNSIRNKRGAGNITFKINPDTMGKKVTATIDKLGKDIIFNYNSGTLGFTSNVTVSDDYLKNGLIAGFEGLDTTTVSAKSELTLLSSKQSELDIFNKLISNIFNKLTIQANSNNAFQVFNKNTNYARKKLRFNFLGKLIIQPMDTIHIYVNSKSRYDNKLTTGLKSMFSGAGILQNLNKTTTDLKNASDTLFNPSGSATFQSEKAAFVGQDFPNYLWALLRNQFVSEKEGTHVFAGVITSATDDWSSGVFKASISGSDNSYYFDLGKVNFKPGVDTFNGSLYDPLTPFKTNFDTVSSNAVNKLPELLPENQILLGTIGDGNSPIVKTKLGPFAGQKIGHDNYVQDYAIDKKTGFISKTFYAPDGLVYKWKEGIGVLVQFGNSLDLYDASRVGSPAITNDPFAGQDVMNVISLLVTGNPYNFANYWKTVKNFDGFAKDPYNQQDSAYSYYQSLRNDLVKNNTTWGNFIPFKNLVMDEQSYAKALQGQIRATSINSELDSKFKKLFDLDYKARLFGSGVALSISDLNSKFDSNYKLAQKQLETIKSQIQPLIDELAKLDKTSPSLKDIGGDTTLDTSQFIDSSDSSKQQSDPSTRKLLRRQTNFLTRRMSYNVRSNEDKNLFIVDDFYDKDYDIAAFNQDLANGIALYNSEFTSVGEKIKSVAHLLNLEVFCDTQGHVRVRPPQYNRMPSSVFYKMLHMKRTMNIQVFPEFLDELIGDQIRTMKEKLEILEDQIRLDCAVIGINDDESVVKFLLSGGSGTQGSPTDNSGDTFSFVSDHDTGIISDFNNIIASANSDQRDDSTQALAHKVISDTNVSLDKLKKQVTSNKNIFDNSQKFSVLLQSVTDTKIAQAGYGILDLKQYDNNSWIDTLITRIQTSSGQKISRNYFLAQADVLDTKTVLTKSIDIYKVISDLSEKIRDRQKLLKIFYGTVKNAVEFKSLDDDSSLGNKLLTPGNYNNANIPEVFEHMIEDESYDDYGLYSGTRYVIKRAQIKQLSIGEHPPDYNMVRVDGVLNPFNSASSVDGLNGSLAGGNGLVSAAAVDYDLWRNYGLMQTSTVTAPFLSDPNTQCAPYAAMLLSKARKNILQGSLTISGNEFMQPGEVIFLEDRGLLFYVSSVSHNFTFNSSFTTTLKLSYGHSPGEYIPTTLDMIGKLIYKNKDLSSLTIQRQSTSGNDSNVGLFIKPKSKDSTQTFEANQKMVENILYTSAYIINSNNTKGNNIKAKLELRLYYDKNNAVNEDLKNFAVSMKTALTSDNAGATQLKDKMTKSSGNVKLKPDDVTIIFTDMDNESERRSPSQKAIDSAREYVNTPDVSALASKTGQDALRQSLFGYIVDCWIKIDQVPKEVAKAGS